MVSVDSECYRECPEQKTIEKGGEKKFKAWAWPGRGLVITVKLAQFLTDRAQSGTSRFRMLPGVSWAKRKLKKEVKKFQGRGRDLVITVKLAQFLTDRAQNGTNRFRISPGVSWTRKILMAWYRPVMVWCCNHTNIRLILIFVQFRPPTPLWGSND